MDTKCILTTGKQVDKDLDKQMLDALRSRFELQGLAIAQLPETIENSLIQAGQTMASTLLNEHKILVFGQGDAEYMASNLVEELTDSSNLERPPLPSVLIKGSAGIEGVERHVQALGKKGDALLVIQSSRQRSNRVSDTQISELCQRANSIGLKIILVCCSELPNLKTIEAIKLTLEYNSRMNYLNSLTTTTMTLVSLIDYHLFGQSI